MLVAAIGALNLFYLIGVNSKINKWNYRRIREARIKSHQDFPIELIRLNTNIQRVLFECSNDHPSLVNQGGQVLKSLNYGEVEFNEKISIFQGTYQVVHNKIGEWRFNKHRWKTTEFMDTVGTVSIYLDRLDKIFTTIYRAAGSRKEGTTIPIDATMAWESFRQDYNSLLQEWKTFTDRAVSVLGYGSQCQAKPAEPLR